MNHNILEICSRLFTGTKFRFLGDHEKVLTMRGDMGRKLLKRGPCNQGQHK